MEEKVEQEVWIKYWDKEAGSCWRYFHESCLTEEEQAGPGVYRINGQFVHDQAVCFGCKKRLREVRHG